MSNISENRVIAVSAPGKVILSGEHSVVYDRKACVSVIFMPTVIHQKDHP